MQLKTILVATGLLLLAAGTAEAYPQFQFSTDTIRCNMCHFAPAGGGLVNSWGREESDDTISASDAGNGEFLHGLWVPPEWLYLGGDYRGVLGIKDDAAQDPDYLAFPMQADIYSVLRFGDWTVAVTGGVRGSARPRDPPVESRFGSREHYVMWRPKTQGHYARAGRFYAPFGLRQPDHTLYARRHLGFYAWEETYGVNYGFIGRDKWEFHATAFMRDPILEVGRDVMGGAFLYERRFRDDTASYGVQSKIELGELSDRYIFGGLSKWWFADSNLLLLSELDLVLETFSADEADARAQVLGHLNLSWTPKQGYMIGTMLEHYSQDVSLSGVAQTSGSLTFQYFPRAHWEVMVLSRYQRAGGGADSLLSMLMLHYYL